MTLYTMIVLLLSCTYITSSAPVDHRQLPEETIEAIVTVKLVGSVEAHAGQLFITCQSTNRAGFNDRMHNLGE